MFRDAQQARLPMFGDALNKRKTCSTRYKGEKPPNPTLVRGYPSGNLVFAPTRQREQAGCRKD